MRAIVAGLLIAGAIAAGVAAPRAPRAVSSAQDNKSGDALARGKKVYEQNCAGCHGSGGLGDGPASPYLFPKPRDFSLGLFKLTSTAQGTLPTDEDLLRTVTNGMPGSAMPSWELLSVADRKDVVAYVKTLVRFYDEDEQKWVGRYDLDGPGKPIEIPDPPAVTPEVLARGKLVYRRAECFKCHGDEGRGDGIVAPTLRDQWGREIRPRDFTAGHFKGGNDPRELFKRVSIGVNGTPMPAHEHALSAAERWDVVFYVLSMARPGAQEMTRQARRSLVSRRVQPAGGWADPMSPLWLAQKDTYVALMPLWWRDRRVEGLLVKSVHDGSRILVRLEWEDATKNGAPLRAEDFRDAAAIQWARTADAPFLAMGAGVEDVNIWMWKADRDQGASSRPDVQTVYPNYDSIAYPETSGWHPGDTDASARNFVDLGPKLAAGWAARNPVSDPTATTPVENLVAHGFSTLSPVAKALRRVDGWAIHDKGTWCVVVSRAFPTQDSTEAPLAPGKHVPVAFAVWDGAARDRNGQKSISIWQDFEIEK